MKATLHNDTGQTGAGYLTTLGAWALAFGCSVGWGAILLPEGAFLPAAGPVGTVLGLGVGALAMLVMAANYHYLMNLCPESGGTYSYARNSFGYDHGFLTAWFLVLTYSAILWANALALPRAVNALTGGAIRFGFHYEVGGAPVYLGEILLALLALGIGAALCLRRELAVKAQIVLALALLLGVAVCFALAKEGGQPAYGQVGTSRVGFLSIAALAPWAYVGFESVCHWAPEARFPLKKSFGILAAALAAGWATYGLVALLAAKGQAAEGYPLLGLVSLCAVFAGLIGSLLALSRLLRGLSEDGILKGWFGESNNSIFFLLGVSALIPFLGWSALGWIVDVTAVSGAITYAIVSAAAWRSASREKKGLYKATGVLGLLASAALVAGYLLPNLSVKVLPPQSYLILAVWGILGFLVLRNLLLGDRKQKLGRSAFAMVILLGTILLSSGVWLAQTVSQASGRNLNGQVALQVCLIVIAQVIMMDIFALVQRRERSVEIEKAVAVESTRAKSAFLSNMSHEIRTPMNAIIGLDSMALRNERLEPQTREQLEKIGASARQLLGLMNDTLDMGLIESGSMLLMEEEFSLRQFLDQINETVKEKCAAKGLYYECGIVGEVKDYYWGDDAKIKRLLLNILDNAVKFTEAPGRVVLSLEQTEEKEKECTLRFVVRDTGIGMEEEYLPKLFEPFSQEDLTNASRYGGSGLGMAITKSFVDMMGGQIQVESKKGVGTTFTVSLRLKASERGIQTENGLGLPEGLRAAVVDGDPVSGERARVVLREIGIPADRFTDPWEAIERIREAHQRGAGYELVITDYKLTNMNGLELTRMIRQFDGGKTAVIMLTGYNWDTLEDEVALDGVDSIGAKPLFADSLLREIQSVLARKSGRDAPADTQAEEPPELVLNGRRVLMAEDLELNKEILEDILSLMNVRSEHAGNGKVAVEMFTGRPQGYYDAIIMDVRMPVMDGLDATRAIRALDRPDAKTIPIIAMTANVFDMDVQNSMQAGMNAHLTKPVEPDILFHTLARLISAGK